MKHQVKMTDLCSISCFLLLFMCFSWKVSLFIKKCHFSWKRSQVNMCVYMHHVHIYVPHAHMCTTCTTKHIYMYIYIIYTYMHHMHTTKKMHPYMHHNKYMHHIHHHNMSTYIHYIHIHVPHTYTCTTYTYMHNQIPPKYKIYLVGLTSELYEIPGQYERSVLKQMFLLLFSEKCSFQWKVPALEA